MEVAEGPPSDNTIFATLASVNKAEVDAGSLARERVSDPSVRAFAGDMVREHTELQRQADQLAAKLELAPQPLADDTVQARAAAAETTLNAAQGAAFDRAYLRSQIDAHDNAVRMLRSAQGAAANPELKALIRGTVPKVQQHLQRARDLQRRLGGGA
jgi:putative membrane protein